MSNRVFRGFTEDSTSDFLKKRVNKENISLLAPSNVNSPCYNFKLCSTTTIQKYNTLKNLETFYNDKTEDKNGNYYFNGEMNQSNFLHSNINNSSLVVNQLVTNLSNNAMSLNLTESDSIERENLNLFNIDPSGILDISCSNIFFTQNNNISYKLQNINNIMPRFKITTKLPNTVCYIDQELVAVFTGTSGTKYYLYRHDISSRTKAEEVLEILNKGYSFPQDFYTNIPDSLTTAVDGITMTNIINIAETILGSGVGVATTVLFINPSNTTRRKFVSKIGSTINVSATDELMTEETEAWSGENIYYWVTK